MGSRRADGKFNDLLTWVYFIRAVSDQPAIKIGQSGNLKLRFTGISVSCPMPLKMICAIRAYDCVEIALHDLFANESIRGEWFSESPRLLKFIGRLIAEHNGRRVPTSILIDYMRDANLEGMAKMEPWYRRLLRNSHSEGGAKPNSAYRPRDLEFLRSLNLISTPPQ